RRDKKAKTLDQSTEDSEKISEEIARQSPQPSQSSESLSQDTKSAPQPQPQRQASKLQKSPPSKLSPKNSVSRGEKTNIKAPLMESQATNSAQSNKIPPKLNVDIRSTPAAQPEVKTGTNSTSSPIQVRPSETERNETAQMESPKDARRGMFSPIRDVLRSSPSVSEPKPEKARKAKQRMPIDDFDSSSDVEDQLEPSLSMEGHNHPAENPESYKERLSESPVQVLQQEQPARPNEQGQHPPALMIDTSSQEDPSTSPVSPLSSAELIEAPHEMDARQETPASTAQSSNVAPMWSDASLRSYLEDDGEIRDLLVVVHDKSDVKPVSTDHPRIKNLFQEENRKLGEISSRLDGLLGDWLARKSKSTPP
ncbi:MAG: hypothetical protein Q9190_007677, partial [Brigantiaea leucoxantha]